MKKWLISGFYNPNIGFVQNRTVNLIKNLGFSFIGDFNATMANYYLAEFCASYNLKNLIKHHSCFNPYQPCFTNPPKTF